MEALVLNLRIRIWDCAAIRQHFVSGLYRLLHMLRSEELAETMQDLLVRTYAHVIRARDLS